jgi:hypothetical protein
MPIIRGGPSNRDDCARDKGRYCWDAFYGGYRCETPEPVLVKCSKEEHNIPAFENNSVWKCDICGKLYIFKVSSNIFSVNGFVAEWQIKQFQRLMFWEKKC